MNKNFRNHGMSAGDFRHFLSSVNLTPKSARESIAELEPTIAFEPSQLSARINNDLNGRKGKSNNGRLAAYRQSLIEEGYSPALADVNCQIAIDNLARELRAANPQLAHMPDDYFQARAAELLNQPA